MAEEELDENPEVKPKRVYKGTDTTLAALRADGERFIPIQILETEYAGSKPKNQWDYKAPAVKLPRIAVLDRLEDSVYKDHVILRANSQRNFEAKAVHLPKDWPVRVLTGRLGQELKKAHAEWQRGRIPEQLGYTKLAMGSDPEIFVEDGDGGIIPAFAFLPPKKNPACGPNDGGGYPTIYWDGFQAEFTTTPNACIAFHVDSIHYGLKGLRALALEHNKKARLSLRSVVPVDPEVLSSAAPEHVAFGCMPSKNIYGLSGKGTDGRDTPMRFAGGHIHLGGGPRGEKMTERIVHALDAILGVASVSMFEVFDNPVRREYYGQPGEYRLPPHGIEYRTLSNAWMVHPAITHLTFDLARQCLRMGEAGLLHHWDSRPEEWIDIIMHSDAKRARAVIRRNEGLMRGLLRGLYGYCPTADTAYDTIMRGVHEVIEDPADFVKNWYLDCGWVNHSEAPKAMWARAAAQIQAGKKL